jgi:peptidoglycan LD-endopeptidase CwlK
MKFVLGKRSLSRLQGVDEDIVRVIKRAIELTPIDFTVLEGLRTKSRQAQLLKRGATRTMNSRHITGHAVDIAPLVGGKIPWNDWDKFATVANSVFEAADELGVLIQWGGDWDGDGDSKDETFLDGPHYQVPWPYRIEACEKAQKRRVTARNSSEPPAPAKKKTAKKKAKKKLAEVEKVEDEDGRS